MSQCAVFSDHRSFYFLLSKVMLNRVIAVCLRSKKKLIRVCGGVELLIRIESAAIFIERLSG